MTRLHRGAGLLGAIVVGLVAAVLPAVPAADAAVAPWTWKRVVQNVSAAPSTSYAIRVFCPTNYTAITGGLVEPILASVRAQGQYRQDDGSGSSWTVNFRNFSTSTVAASVVAECVETADLPPISYQLVEFDQDVSGYAEGAVSCLNAGEVVLTGGVDWSGGALNRELMASAPATGDSAWYGYGYNPESAVLGVEVYCVNAANVPGYQHVQFARTGAGGWYTDTVTCPVGKRILNGGTFPTSFASYPNLTSWTSTIERAAEPSHTTRATCIDAGLPTVALTYTSPGPPGSFESFGNASFSMAGTDPAGYPNNFRCSLDGGTQTSCNAGASYTGLLSGTHQFEAWNTTPDGRTSAVASYQWMVDRIAPTVTTPKLPKVTLTASAAASWRGTDAHSGIDHYEAAYRIFGVDGTANWWTTPPDWSDLGRSVQTPNIAQGQTVCVSVRSFDKATNASPWSPPSCTTRPFDDRALDASAGWTRATGSAYWLNTVTRTQASGQTLKRSDVHLNRVGILATQCADCGVVVVKVGDTKIGRINLGAGTLANRKVRLLPAFGDQTGIVRIKSVTSGKKVAIDALVAIQAVTAPPP
ncbi:MAG: hypothetical protein ABI586_04080 [Candidatus Nanopelagicales bacterium]